MNVFSKVDDESCIGDWLKNTVDETITKKILRGFVSNISVIKVIMIQQYLLYIFYEDAQFMSIFYNCYAIQYFHYLYQLDDPFQ